MSGPRDIGIAAERVDALACSQCGHHIDLRACPAFSEVECPECGTRQRVPLRLGNFYLLEELGRGGMGAVYKALDQTLGRYVGLKVMRREMGKDAEALEKFLHEARAAAALNHPNVVQIYSCGQEQGQPYIVMEMVGGGRLDELMESGKKVDEVRVMQVAVEVAKGLEAAHDIGLVHGDIKPANILFGSRGEAKVVDFGLARFVASQQAPGEVWGTPFYIAPEKVRKQPEDHRSDIYSLGATLYHALTGVPPFDGPTAKEVVLARLKGPARPIRTRRIDLHLETAQVLARMLEQDPGRRYPTYTSLLPDLEAALAAARAGPVKGEEVKKHAKGRLAIAAAVLAVVAGGIGFALTRGSGGEQAPEPEVVYYRLVDGKPVPVYAGEEPTPEPGSKTPPAVGAEPAEPVPEPEALFTRELEGQLRSALAFLAAGKAAAARSGLEEVWQQSPAAGEHRLWVRLFQGVAAWADGDQAAYAEYVGEVADLDPVNTDAEVSAKTLGRYMKGDISTAAMVKKEVAWTAGAKALRTFLVGLVQINGKDYDKAVKQLDAYVLAKPASGLGWAYAAQPFAESVSAQVKQWTTLEDRAAKAANEQGRTRVMRDLAALGEKAVAPIRVEAEAGREAIRDQLAEAAAQRLAERLLLFEKIQSDLDLIDASREKAARWIVEYDFKGADHEFTAASSSLTTEKGRAWRAAVSDGYQRMDALKEYLVAAIQKKPPGDEAKHTLGVSVVGATDKGVRVRFLSGAVYMKSWREIGPRNFLWITDYYAGQLQPPARAKKLLAAALFCYEAGAMEPAQVFARKALDASPAVRRVIDRNMPDLLD